MKIGIFIEPTKPEFNYLIKWKKRIKGIFGNQKYLSHPIHTTIAVFDIKKTIKKDFFIGNTKIETFKHNHGPIDVQTYRINKFAYSTDIKNFYENDIDKLKNLDLWIVGLLRYDPHPSHAGFDQIIDYIKYLKPKKTLFTHMTALLDQKELLSKCPENVEPAYDGMVINL